jgi:hydroxymethylbilane synthase
VIRIGTRGSALALAQAQNVAAALGAGVDIVPIRTEGDRLAEARLALVGGKGLFVREIEEALLRGDVDVAVHSLKDLPAEPPPGLLLAAFLPREDARDVLATRAPATLEGLRPGAVICESWRAAGSMPWSWRRPDCAASAWLPSTAGRSIQIPSCRRWGRAS